MNDFLTLPDAPALRLDNLTLPGCLAGSTAETVRGSLTVSQGRIVADAPGAASVDMKGAMAFPTFVDMHTHLDKGHIWPRTPNLDGSFAGALTAVGGDREAAWSAEDVRTRMTFALRAAYAHGTGAIRTHLDSIPPQDDISWGVFREVRQDWAGRIALQAACLLGCEGATNDGPFTHTADLVAASGGILGMVTYPVPGLQGMLDTFFDHAIARGLEVDFHADETMDPEVNTLKSIAETVLERGFDRPVTVGHLCSLSTMPEAEALRTLDLVAKAGLNVVSLPMCNLYLQDRHAARTPRGRGITLVHEMKARGINVSFASDNTRDPFYAYGDLDMLEVMREATRIGHLDHADPDWTLAFTVNPARACGFAAPSFAPGAPADLVICRARSWTELFARPQSDRIVLRGGRAIDRTLPDYAELDHLMRTA
ncbi:MAG: cytosine deaminase [Limimaricola sp.]|uniref:cytosine deaminase n=1 Tax=Limimaricola sp. TaxID=2211665 RepID=UPI001D3F9355|nr:cytosine deaminase [Limimaricola sp.]MBI1418159.1 cytosine deaminase [Limimaricola sp.]